MKELQKFINESQGFYSQNAFPMRSLQWQIKNYKQQQYQFDGLTKDQQIQQVENKKQKINKLEEQINFTKPTRLLYLFQQIFDSKDYYNLYLKFTDQLRKFNEQNTYQLQEENQKINEELQKKKQEKKQRQNQNQDVSQINEQIKQLKNQLEQNLEKIELRNIGIELFWRELIQIKQKGQSSQLKINPAEIVANMVKKGEPFEFLDGDLLQIDQKFLLDFIKNFPNPNEKVLVLSVLGPQSSGKSTILNKIFGCHFWTSVGRCTKGIYLQLLKITQKKYFDNEFDYVLILDSEGLQNPNQNDPEFDKKIALFVLAISDIILINVKGDIHSQFKNLVEMCIFTLGQMKSSISSVKQLSWCFNQNNDCKNFAPFLDQIQSIVNTLNLQINKTEDGGDNSAFDYNEVLDLKKENIKILGFASTEKSWSVNPNTGIYEEWRQQIINETFSEEAYQFGVQMIKQFVRKLKMQQENSLPSLSSFVQNVESTWQSICRLPDLLEFTELLQYKQDQSMKNKYEQLLRQQSFDYQTKIPKKIQEQIIAEKKKNLEFFKRTEEDEKKFIKQEIEKIKNNVEQELQKHKTENKIQNKICKKYIKLLEDYLQTYEYNCHITLLDEIKKYEREFQEIKGFTQIEDFVGKISQNAAELKNLKENKQQIKQEFNRIWKKIISDVQLVQEQVYYDYSQAQYQAIYSQFTKYQYNSQNQQFYKEFFLKLSKSKPKKQNHDEKQKIFNNYIQEIISQQQFQTIINNNQNMKYYDIFCQPLKDRLRKSDHNYIVDLNLFYQQQFDFYIIAIEVLKNYLQSDELYNDFQIYLDKQTQQSQNWNTSNNKDKKIREFIGILDQFQIQYSSKKFNELKQNLTEGNKWYQFGDQTKSYFINFQKTIKLTQINQQIIMHPEFTRNISYYYPSLFFEEKSIYYNNDQDYQLQLQQYSQYVLLQLNNKFVNQKQDQYETFSYIADQKANYYQFSKFNFQIIRQFSSIITDCNGWQRIYSEIYDIIKQKMVKLKNQNDNKKIGSDSENEETLTSDQYLVIDIMASIEQKIKEYNKQFANFGIILNSIGERLIYYYSMFVIWRFSSYSKWKLIEQSLQKLDQMQDEQLNRFINAIEQNTTEISQSNAQIVSRSIKQGFLERFYSDQLKSVEQSINSITMTCRDYVKQLDQRLLENYQKAKQNNIQDSEIVNYILDQKGYIEKSVDNLIKEKERELLKDYEQKLRQELHVFLNQVKNNITIIYYITRQQNNILKSQDYFDINDEDYKNDDYDGKLFNLICKCIQGEKLTKEQLQNIRQDQKEIFDQNYEFIKCPIFVKMLNDSEKKIPLLKPFIQELFNMMQNEIDNSLKESLILDNLKIQEHLNKIRVSMNGCKESCPLCKRKCDQPNDSNHKHTCFNGHQLRGMNGVLINNRPSLFTCEEIDDNSLISTSDSSIQKKWSDVKKVYSEWRFNDLKDQKVIEIKEKMMNIWNSGIGQLVCQKLSQKLNIDIQFQIKTDFNEDQSIHYILMLDDSGSMEGQQWQNAKNGALQCMQEIAKNGLAKVSVVIFNHEARVAIDCEKVNIDKQKDLITFDDGLTSFNNAFLKAYDQLQKHLDKKFDKIIILFYTDGGDSYPADAVNKFCQLMPNIKENLQLVSCAEGDVNQIASLVKLTDNFNKSGISAELKPNINVNDIKKVWSEVVNQNYHKIKF